jgi:CHAT domain-containing protein/uncharacterized protein HemY
MHYGRAIVLASLVAGMVGLTPAAGRPGMAQMRTQTENQQRMQADLLFEQGNKLLGQNQNEGAIAAFQRALAIYRELKERQKEGQTLKTIGNVYINLEDYQKAIDYHRKTLVIAREVKDRDLEGRALNNLGIAYKRLKDPAKAIDYYQQSLAIAHEISSLDLEKIVLSNLVDADSSSESSPIPTRAVGSSQPLSSDNQKTIEDAQKALMVARRTKNFNAEAIALDALTKAYAFVHDSQKTIESAHQGLIVAQRIKNRFLEARALVLLGNAYSESSEYQKAIEFAHRALIISQETKDTDVEALALDTLARSYIFLGDVQKTTEFSQQSLAAAQRIQNKRFEGRALALLGASYNALGDYQKAIELSRKSFIIAQEIKDRDLEYLATYTLADVYYTLSENKQAVKFAQKALGIALELQNPSSTGETLVLLGKIYDSSKEYAQAIKMAQKGLTIAQRLKNHVLEAKALNTVGSAYYSLDEYQKALEFAQKSLAIAREIKKPSEEISASITLSGVYARLGDYKRFDEFSQQALTLARNNAKDPILEVYALLIISVNSFSQKDYQKMLQSAQQGISVADTITIPHDKEQFKLINLLLLSAGYNGSQEYSKAVELATQALKMAQEQEDEDWQGRALNLLGDIYRKTGQREKAIDAYGESLSLGEDDPNAQAGIARVYQDLGLPTTAITHYKQAINQIEDTRKDISGLPKDLQKSFLKAFNGLDNIRNTDIYRELADLLIAQGSFGEAQQVMELLKIQELNDFSKKTRSLIPISTVELSSTEKFILADYGDLIGFIQKVATCQAKQCPDLDTLIEQRDRLNRAFIDRMKGIEQQAAEARKTGIASRKDDFTEQAEKIVAQPQTLLIYPLVLNDRVRVLWTATGKVYGATECLIGQDQLWKETKAFHNELRTPSSLDQAKAKGKTLYDCLVAPLEGIIKANNIKHLVFAPDLATNYIPLGALYDGNQFLIQRFTISNIVDARSTDTDAHFPQNPQVLALGMSKSATTGTTTFPPLLSVPPELASIVKTSAPHAQGVFPGIELLNADFTQTGFARKLRQGNFTILHFATHAAFTPTNPNGSFLLLGDGKALTIPDIQNLDGLRTVHLVVLSACQTALSDAKDGVEVRAISSYFLSRAKTVVASLWNVNDSSTALIMQQFYKHLASGMTKTEALQKVQQDFISGKHLPAAADRLRSDIDVTAIDSTREARPPNFTHPYYWAPFILIGNSL